MSLIYNRRTTGLFENGAMQKGDDTNFSGFGSTRTVSGDYLSNGRSLYMNNVNARGSGFVGAQYIPVDTSKVYQLAYSVKTITQSYNSRNGSGHLGYITYDENKNFIELRNCKGVGDTTLTRAASPGDTTIYVASASGWSTSATNYFRGLMLFGGSYPYSGGYTRYWVPNNAYPTNGLTDLGGGEWSITLNSGLPTWSDALDANGDYPIGTYLSNGRAGGTYNYAMGAPVYPQTWTTYSAVCTGETRGSGATFRYGTKFIRFMQLSNYNYRTEQAGDSARYVMDNLFFGEIPSTSDTLPTSFLQSDRFR